MSNKIKGIITPIIFLVVMIVLSIVLALVVSETSSDGWAAIGVLFMAFGFTGLALIIMFIVGLVLYLKKESDYGTGLMIGFFSIGAFSVLTSIIVTIYNAIVL